MDRATAMELKLSRKVANEIQWVIDSGGVMPVQILNAYKPLKAFYDSQIIDEEYKATTNIPKQVDLFD